MARRLMSIYGEGLKLKVANGQITPIFIRLIKHAVALHALEGVVEGCLRPCSCASAAIKKIPLAPLNRSARPLYVCVCDVNAACILTAFSLSAGLKWSERRQASQPLVSSE